MAKTEIKDSQVKIDAQKMARSINRQDITDSEELGAAGDDFQTTILVWSEGSPKIINAVEFAIYMQDVVKRNL